MTPARLSLGLILAVGLSGFVTSCSDEPGALTRLVPNAPRELAQVLEHSDEERFARAAGESGADALIDLHHALRNVLYQETPLDSGDEAQIRRALEAVDRALETGHFLPSYATESRYLRELPRNEARHRWQRWMSAREIFDDAQLDPAAKLQQISVLTPAIQEDGYTLALLDTWYNTGLLHHRLGNHVEARQQYQRIVRYSRETGGLPQEAQARVQLLMYKMREGWSAADRDTLRQLEERARRARLATSTSLCISMRAYDELNQERFPTARALFEDSIEVCHEFGAPSKAMSSFELLLRLYADMECWKQVDTLIARARQAQAEAEELSGEGARTRLALARCESVGARSLAARGLVEEAHVAFEKAFRMAVGGPFADAGFVGKNWVQAMLLRDRPDLAAEALAPLEEYARSNNATDVMPRLRFWQACLQWSRGEVDSADASLARYTTEMAEEDTYRTADLAFWPASLKGRIDATRDLDRAEAGLSSSWRALMDRMATLEPGPETYLDLSQHSVLRRTTHELLGQEPRVGYGLELLWRRGFSRRASMHSALSKADLRAAARLEADRAQAELSDLDAVHCLYQVQREHVVRWTVDGESVERDVLSTSTDRLRALVQDALSELGTDPGSSDALVPAELAGSLALLARELLPERCFDPATRPRRLLVSGESFLAQVPFSPLNLGSDGDYEPLIAVMDLAWLRGAPRALVFSPLESSLVIADPALDAVTRRRFELPMGLPGASAELARIQSVLPSSSVLAASDASSARVIAEWENCELLYFVGHAVRDLEVPFMSWLPLAPSAQDELFPGLQLKDILAADLERCQLVILSGCATGAPYVDGMVTTPSLGDAFLDAGAGAAIQTFWKVRDEGSSFQPERVLASVVRGDADLIAAVSQECRRALRGPNGIRHPFGWAAWTLKARG